jgi:hypothetical protein
MLVYSIIRANDIAHTSGSGDSQPSDLNEQFLIDYRSRPIYKTYSLSSSAAGFRWSTPMRSGPDPFVRQAVLIIIFSLAVPAAIGYIVGGFAGLLVGFGVGAIIAVLLGVAALKQGSVGGDLKLDAGVFVECPCGYCGGRSIKKLLPDTSTLPNNRPGHRTAMQEPELQVYLLLDVPPGGNTR